MEEKTQYDPSSRSFDDAPSTAALEAEIVPQLLSLPKQIREKMLDILLMQSRINETEFELKQWEAEQIQDIATAVDENGRKLFSNEKLRQAELERRKAEDQRYKQLSEALQEYKEQQEKDRIELEYLRYQFRALEIYTRFLEATRGL
jgi:hypothetical protein